MIDLFNLISNYGKIPKCWKIGEIIYFPKSNRKITSPSDHRSINLLNNFFKISEQLIIKRIDDKLNQLNFYSPIQYDLKKNTSTINAINSMITKIESTKKNYLID